MFDERLDGFHHRRVVTERAVGFEHGELGVVPAREAFVAEILPDLEEPINAAHEQPLVIQLQRDAQVEVAAERVVEGLEGLRRGAAGNGLHRGRLDLDVAASVEELANLMHDGAALEEDGLHLGIAHEVEVTLAVANLGVFEAVPLGGRRAEGLGEDGEGFELHARLVGLGAKERAGDADEIAEVEVFEDVELRVAEGLFLRVNLDASALIAHVDEDGFAHVAMRGDAAGDGDLRAFGERAGVEAAAGFVAFAVGRELIAEGENVLGRERLELGAALFDQ